jgi:peptide/nickel transport system ATP-binding protein
VSDDPLLSVRDLKKHYPITEGLLGREVGRVRAVDGISFDLFPGETLGLVGESGCGKSTAATSLLRLEEPTAGSVTFGGEDIGAYDRRELKRFRRRAQLVFQDPTSSFDPRMSVGEAIAEPLEIHGVSDADRRRAIVEDALERVGLSADDYRRYPHEFSGGQKQRAALARALVVNPDLLVADEPVSALDVSVQAEILDLLEDLQADFDLSILVISHDMGVVREICDRVAVMYLGEIVEVGPTGTVFEDPQHPYTRALLSSIPVPDPGGDASGVELSGEVPSPEDPPSGCRFHTRCPAVVPPESFAFEGAEWRAVMDLRVALSTGQFDPAALREGVVVAGDAPKPAAVTDDQLHSAVRERYGIPGELSDPQAESVLADALAAVVAGDLDTADDRLSAAFETVCERDHPELSERGEEHEAACHLDSAAVETPSPTTDD